MTAFFASLPLFLLVGYVIFSVAEFSWNLFWGFYSALTLFRHNGLSLKMEDYYLLPKAPELSIKVVGLISIALGIPATYVILHLQFVP